ncbi:MAG TPA: type II toxin-antitoxin system RelE/ParE family toxin [Thermoanaerobaculia bacterium]
MRRFEFDPAVKSDLRKIKRYEKEQPGLGEDFLTRARRQFEQIARHPLAYPIVEKDVRKIDVGKFQYEIYYLVNEEEIFVFAVIHKRQHQDTWKRRL